MKKPSLKRQIKALEKSIAKWEKIHDLIHHDRKAPCGCCTLNNSAGYCPLKKSSYGGDCVYAWIRVHKAVDNLIAVMEKELGKFKELV